MNPKNSVADKKAIQKLLKLIQKTSVEEITVSENGVTLRVKRLPQATPVEIAPVKTAAETAPSEALKPLKSFKPVRSKNIGIFNLAKKIEIGSSIKEGQVVGQVTAMGIKNDIAAEISGKIADILVEDGSVVDYGQAVLSLE